VTVLINVSVVLNTQCVHVVEIILVFQIYCQDVTNITSAEVSLLSRSPSQLAWFGG